MGQCMGQQKSRKYSEKQIEHTFQISNTQMFEQKASAMIYANESQLTSQVPLRNGNNEIQNLSLYQSQKLNSQEQKTKSQSKALEVEKNQKQTQTERKRKEAQAKIRTVLERDQKIKRTYQMINQRMNKPK